LDSGEDSEVSPLLRFNPAPPAQMPANLRVI
jgi:hypothetical protein